MTFLEYQQEALKTLHPSGDAMYLATKLMCEAAEVTEPIAKNTYHGKHLDSEVIADELGDVLWYLATLANLFGYTLDEIVEKNIAKIRARHGERYNANHYMESQYGN